MTKPQLVVQDLSGRHNDNLGDSIERIRRGGSWKKQRMVVIVPSADLISAKVMMSFWNLAFPPNNGVVRMLAVGMEVGEAYSTAIEQILAHPQLRGVDPLFQGGVGRADPHRRAHEPNVLERRQVGRPKEVAGAAVQVLDERRVVADGGLDRRPRVLGPRPARRHELRDQLVEQQAIGRRKTWALDDVGQAAAVFRVAEANRHMENFFAEFDHAGHDDAAGGVDLERPVGGGQTGPDLGDAVADDADVDVVTQLASSGAGLCVLLATRPPAAGTALARALGRLQRSGVLQVLEG